MDHEDDEVGYGKPPRHTRFATGRSGNPKGRPKGSSNIKAAIRRATERRVSVKMGKRTVKMKPIDAMAYRLMQKALDGDLKAMRELVMFGGLQDEFAASTQRASTLTGEDLDLMRRALARMDPAGAAELSCKAAAPSIDDPSDME
jgi:hypothetical protein